MRLKDIRFKAKRLDNGQWVYGIPAKNYNHEPCIFVAELAKVNPQLGFVKVDPSTVCQYTGRNAENDVPIYEGDIVECTYFNEQGDDIHCTGTVAWEQDVWGAALCVS